MESHPGYPLHGCTRWRRCQLTAEVLAASFKVKPLTPARTAARGRSPCAVGISKSSYLRQSEAAVVVDADLVAGDVNGLASLVPTTDGEDEFCEALTDRAVE